METNNKYYTPELSEIHVGFEIEVQQQEMLLDECVYTDEWLPFTYDGDYTPWSIQLEHIRVKFLDKEDIESFGFIHDRSYMFNLGQYRLHFIQSDNELDIIHIYDNESNDDTIFLGYIKNKSELKFILTRLGIIQ